MLPSACKRMLKCKDKSGNAYTATVGATMLIMMAAYLMELVGFRGSLAPQSVQIICLVINFFPLLLLPIMWIGSRVFECTVRAKLLAPPCCSVERKRYEQEDGSLKKHILVNIMPDDETAPCREGEDEFEKRGGEDYAN